MSSTLLERARAFHEDVETCEEAIIGQLEEKPRTNKGRVMQQHCMSNLLDQVTQRGEELTKIYTDEDFKQEVSQMRGKDAFKSFYEKVKDTWSYHTRYPNMPVVHQPDWEEEMQPKVTFSGEELYGKFFDLHDMYRRFVNLPQVRKQDKNGMPHLDYGAYLERLGKFSDLPEKEKMNGKAFFRYLKDLESYLQDFLLRTQPLVEVGELLKDSTADFEKAWAAGKVAGWAGPTSAAGAAGATGAAGAAAGAGGSRTVDLSKYHSAEDLEALGMNRLKEGLTALGLKAGGTLQQRAARLFSVKGKSGADIDEKLKAKVSKKRKRPDAQTNGAHDANGQANGTANGTADGTEDGTAAGAVAAPAAAGEEGEEGQMAADVDPRKATAAAEAKVSTLLEVLTEVQDASVRQVEKKLTRTVEERNQEMQEEEEGGGVQEAQEEDEEDSEDEGPIYNPLNLPLGWDGKPIPYWLYKLHGLGVKYECEICGDATYWGRRAFDRHFQEWRHADGMRKLGIPNTKHFHDITKIADAQDLYRRIKGQVDREAWNAAEEEEYEDTEGNVVKRRTYEDLARQGLL